MSKQGLSAMEPYRVALEEETKRPKKTAQSGATKPLTVDEREERELTYLEQTNGAQAERDNAAHQAAVKAQEQARQAANRQAYIGNELMQKYLPQYQAAQGTLGMGTSQTDMGAAYNAYLGRVSDNNAGYARNVAALDQSKAERDAQREAELREAKYDAKSRYDYERQTMAENESTGLLGLMDSRANNYYGSDGKLSVEDFNNLAEFYAANESRLTEAGKRNAQDMLAEYKLAIRDAEEQAALDRNDYINKGLTLSRGLRDYGKVGNNFWVKDENGTEYAVELGEQVVDQTVLKQADKADSGEVFAYGGKLYLKKDQDVYAVNRREQTKHEQYERLYDLYFGGGNEKDDVPFDTQIGNADMTVRDAPKRYQAGWNFTVQNGAGRVYDVQIAGVMQHSSKDAAAVEKMVEGKVYPYAGTLVVKSPEGKLYKVEKRTLQSNKKSDYTDLYSRYYQ